ncbi:probable glutamate receptor [Musca autumnalis]|uniref:probable glutamate receptor n=1 Tax=Musca autumnalis TaxID=221902 RepID=UPI003CEC1FC0
MNVSALYQNYHAKVGGEYEEMVNMVGSCILHVMDYYFATSFILVVACQRESSLYFYGDVLDRTLAGWNQFSLEIVNLQRGQRRKVPDIAVYHMVLVDSYESFLAANVAVHHTQNDHNEYYYIFLKSSDTLLTLNMQKIFEYCWEQQLINCIIQTQTGKGALQLYSYYPFTAWSCSTLEIVRINEFNGTAMSTEPLFPKKLTNFHGCSLRAALWDIPPYLSLKRDSKGNLQYDGFEGILLRLLASRLNFTLDIREADDTSRGMVFDNGSTTGVLNMLNSRKLDFALGSYHQNYIRNKVVTPTISYYQSTMSVVIRRSALRLNEAQALIYPFRPMTWYVLLATCATVIVGVYIFRYVRHTPAVQPFTDVFLSILGMPILHMTDHREQRIFSISWMYFTLVIRSLYFGVLFHMIRSHFLAQPPTSLQALIEKNYTVAISKRMNSVVTYTAELRNLNYTVIYDRPESETLAYLLNLSPSAAKRAVGISALEFLQYYILIQRQRNIFQIIPYDLIGFKICIYLPKHSWLSDQFNEILIWIRDSGLLEYWKGMFLDTGYVNDEWQPEDQLFGMAELHTAFMLVIVGYSLAIFIFLVELFYHRVVNRRKVGF